MFWLRLIPPWLQPYVLIALGVFLVSICTVFFHASERLQDRMAKKERNRQDWMFRKMRFLTLWLRRHRFWRDFFRAIGLAGGIFGVVRGLWILLA